jgi:IS30 family transposase
VIKKLLLPVTKVKKFTENIAFAQDLNTNAWYAHLQAALERETNGKSNGLIRQYFPVGTDFFDPTDREIGRVVLILNHSPHNILGFSLPDMVFFQDMKAALMA